MLCGAPFFRLDAFDLSLSVARSISGSEEPLVVGALVDTGDDDRDVCFGTSSFAGLETLGTEFSATW